MLNRFMAKVSPEPNTGCWLWTAHVSRDGYGRFGIGRVAHEAHRVAYKLFKGEIPSDLCVNHMCKVRSCVNPSHLRLLTLIENIKDQINANSLKTVCKNGHDLPLQIGRRVCKPCNAKAAQRYREKYSA